MYFTFLLFIFFLLSHLFFSLLKSRNTHTTHIHNTHSFKCFNFPYRVEDAGSVICLCTRACLIKCSFRAVWTSAGISGEVWLIFIAGSIAFSAGFSFSFSSFFSSVSSTSAGALAGACGRALMLEVTGLLFQQGQHNFQKTKRETTKRARPQKLTTTANKLTETSGEKWQCEEIPVHWYAHKRAEVARWFHMITTNNSFLHLDFQKFNFKLSW